MAIPAFASLFVGPLAPYAESFVLESERPGEAPGTAFADPERFSGLLDLYASHLKAEDGDRRAVASLWSKCHFAMLVPPYLALVLVAGQSVDLALDRISLTFGPDGTTRHVHVADVEPLSGPMEATERFSQFVNAHLSPLVDALAKAGGVSRNVLWSNAGNLFEAVTSRIADLTGSTPALAAAQELLRAHHLQDGRRNPLCEPVRYDETGRRTRKVCCLRDRLPAYALCSTCPLA